jgi:hypothetical protein
MDGHEVAIAGIFKIYGYSQEANNVVVWNNNYEEARCLGR